MSQARYHRGACVLDEWELRITKRCLVEDLKLPSGSSFKDALRCPIVAAFETKRATATSAAKTVGPEAGERTLYHLGQGDDHRGATWFDPEHRVVWLTAYRLHRSASSDDFFEWVKPRIKDGSAYPTNTDRALTLRERALRFRDMARAHATELVELAKATGGIEKGRIAWTVDVRVRAEESGIVSVAFPESWATFDRVAMLVRAFDPEVALLPEDWVEQLPGKPPVPGEIVFTIVRRGAV